LPGKANFKKFFSHFYIIGLRLPTCETVFYVFSFKLTVLWQYHPSHFRLQSPRDGVSAAAAAAFS